MNHKRHATISTESNNTWFVLVLTAYLLISIMPFVSQLAGGVVLMGIYAILIVSVVFCSTNTVNEYFTLLLPLFILSAFEIMRSFLESNTVSAMYVYQLIIAFVPIIAGYWVTKTDDYTAIKVLSIVTFIAYVITTITTYRGTLVDSNATRYLATVSDSSDPYFISLMRQNIGGYSFAYGLVLVFPVLIAFYKQKRIKTPFMALAVIMLFLYFMAIEYALAAILFIIDLVLLFQRRSLSTKAVAIILVILILIVFVFSSLIASVFYWAAEKTDSEALSERFSSIADELSGEEISADSDLANRKTLYQKDLDTFFEYPITGSWIFSDFTSGGHSYLLRILARYGIFGVAIMFSLYRKIYKTFYAKYKDKEYFGYILWSFVANIIISILNTGDRFFIITFIIPLTVAYLDKLCSDSGDKTAKVQSKLKPIRR